MTQMGPGTFKDAGGKLDGMTCDQYPRATPAQQIDDLRRRGSTSTPKPAQIAAASLVKGGIGSLPPEMQAALMQGTQFSPSGLNNGVSWVDALGQGNMSMPVTT